jgi:phytoene dehydrogenase-like protein
VTIHKDLDKTCASLARFSKRDAETFRELWNIYCVEMRPLLVSLLYNAPMPREQMVDRLSGPKAKELLSHAQHDLFIVVRKHFVDERIRTLFTSYMHVITTDECAWRWHRVPGDLRQYSELHATGRRRGVAGERADAGGGGWRR